jgi:predicted tellurium resistance membrane protein TerC
LPKEQQPKARFFGLGLAMGTRILLLLSISWVMQLTNDLFHVFGEGFSGRDLILFFGGLFLLFKSTMEIYHSMEGAEESAQNAGKAHGFFSIIMQIAVIDIIFSLDSVITAVGMVSHVPVMVAAIIISVLVMMLAAGTISDFIEKHPSMKILALSFLIMVGTLLVAEACDVHMPKGYLAGGGSDQHSHPHFAWQKGQPGRATQRPAGLSPAMSRRLGACHHKG